MKGSHGQLPEENINILTAQAPAQWKQSGVTNGRVAISRTIYSALETVGVNILELNYFPDQRND